MKNQKTRRTYKSVLALLLSVLMVITVFTPSLTAFAVSVDEGKLGPDMYLTSKTDYTIAPGVKESQITLNNGEGSNQVKVCVAEVDLDNPYTSVVASYRDYDGTKWGMQKVRDQAAAAERKLGTNVVVGVNGDYFNMQTGAPMGPLVMNGITYHESMSCPYFAILNDGTPVIRDTADSDYAEKLANAKEAIGGSPVLIKNGVITAAAKISSGVTPVTAVGIKDDNSVVIYTGDGRQAPYSCGQTYEELAYAMLSLGCVYAIRLDGGGSTTFLSQHEGSDELVCRNKPSDGQERTVSSALLVCSSAKPTGVFDHASLTPNNDIYTPESSVQFEAVGVDSSGAGVALPKDGKFVLADESFGSITSEGLFKSNGTEGVVTVNYVSGGDVCGTVSIEIRTPDTLYVPNSEVSLGFEETTDFDIEAKYKERDVILKSGDLEWSITDDNGTDISGQAGTFDGLTFTTFDGVTVNANIKATLKYNREITASIKAIIGAMPVVMYDFENYTTDKEEAENNPELKYIPSLEMPTWDRNAGIPDAEQKNQFYEAGYPLYNWPNASITDQKSMKSRIVSKEDGEPVRFGEHSLRIDYDYSTYNGSSNSNNYVRVTDPDYDFEGSPTAIGCWVYVPEGTANFHLYLNCANKNEDPAYGCVTGTQGIDWTGWKYVEFNLNDTGNENAGPAFAPFGFYQGCGVFWISYQANGSDPRGDRTASTIYLDNIQLVYGANTDDIDNPVISSVRTDTTEITDGETVLDSNVNTFRASYADFDGKYATGIDFSEVKMFIDGVDVTDKCYINEGDEEIYFYDAVLPDGVHSIEISVSDEFGNTTTDTRYFTVNGGSSDTVVSFENEDESPVLGEKYTLKITSNNAADVLSADVGIKILSYFTTYWDDFTVVPSANYELEKDASYDEKNTTINFKLNRKADADASADDGTLAKIIFDIPTNVPEGLEVTYRIAKGALTYANNIDEKFVGAFGGKITTTCASPFVLNVDTMVVGSSGGYIRVTDADGNPLEKVNVYTSARELIGVTDNEGKVFTDKYVGSVTEFSIYAEKDGKLSFTYKGQSFPSGGTDDGMPVYIKQNITENPAESQSITWMSSPLASKAEAVALYAEKSEYDAKGEDALKTFNGESVLSEMASSASYTTNYAVRINSAVITGLKPNTEYVYKVGDGEKMSAIGTFSTAMSAKETNFFVIGDTQATDTTNSDKITKLLASSDTPFSFGIQTGDAVDNGGNYTMWANIAKVFSGDFLGSQDMIHVLGNHEYYGDETASNAAAYFNLPGAKDGSAPLCYSTQYGNIYVAVINYSNLSGYREAAEWLVKDASESNATWKILAMHQPAYFTNPSGNTLEMQKIISNAVDEAGIDFVFSGHDHSYARTEPITGGTVDKTDGAVYYICGSTGEKSYEIVKNDAFHFDMLDGDYTAVYLTASVSDTEFTVTTYDLMPDGTSAIIDSYTMTKDVKCSDGEHGYVLDGDYLTCPDCGYSIPKSSYTGFVTDAATGYKKYVIAGNVVTGWFALEDDYYYFDKNGNITTGKVKIDGRTYTFGNDGKLTKGALVKEGSAYYYYIAGEKQRGWHMIDGDWYYFDRQTGFKMSTGTVSIKNSDGSLVLTYTFSDSGKLTKGAWLETSSGTSYYWGPDPVTGLQEIDGETYYFYPNTTYMCVNDSVKVGGKVYSFDEDGIFRHYGAHNDANGDGRCDECVKAKRSIWNLFAALRRFFLMIRDFFLQLFK